MSPKACISLQLCMSSHKTLIVCCPTQEWIQSHWPSVHCAEPAPQEA